MRVAITIDDAASPGLEGIEDRLDIRSGEITESRGRRYEHVSGAGSYTGELRIAVDSSKVHFPVDAPSDLSGVGVQQSKVICAQSHLSRPLTRQAVSNYRSGNMHILPEAGRV